MPPLLQRLASRCRGPGRARAASLQRWRAGSVSQARAGPTHPRTRTLSLRARAGALRSEMPMNIKFAGGGAYPKPYPPRSPPTSHASTRSLQRRGALRGRRVPLRRLLRGRRHVRARVPAPANLRRRGEGPRRGVHFTIPSPLLPPGCSSPQPCLASTWRAPRPTRRSRAGCLEPERSRPRGRAASRTTTRRAAPRGRCRREPPSSPCQSS